MDNRDIALLYYCRFIGGGGGVKMLKLVSLDVQNNIIYVVINLGMCIYNVNVIEIQ